MQYTSSCLYRSAAPPHGALVLPPVSVQYSLLYSATQTPNDIVKQGQCLGNLAVKFDTSIISNAGALASCPQRSTADAILLLCTRGLMLLLFTETRTSRSAWMPSETSSQVKATRHNTRAMDAQRAYSFSPVGSCCASSQEHCTRGCCSSMHCVRIV